VVEFDSVMFLLDYPEQRPQVSRSELRSLGLLKDYAAKMCSG